MTTKERVITEDTSTLADGLKLTTTRALIFKTISTINKVLSTLSILMPAVFALFYIFFIIQGEKSGFRFVTKCVLLPLVIAELAVNTVILLKKRGGTPEGRGEKHTKKVLYYAKFAISLLTNCFAIYEAITYDGAIIQILTTSLMLSFLFARILFEILKLVIEKYRDTLFLALAMDMKKVVNKTTIRGAEAAVGVARAIKNPESTFLSGINKMLDKLEGGRGKNENAEAEPEKEQTLLEEYIERANGDEPKRQRLSRIAAEFKEQCDTERSQKERKKAEELEGSRKRVAERISSLLSKKHKDDIEKR